ncbi:MAG: hypothetical protein K0R73_714 [Candidatus Midichloriaceae bacterium]|nr:hypothetical protein [Candidatus Midichloriaceae bacterium]
MEKGAFKDLFKGVFRLVLQQDISKDELKDLHQFLEEHPNIIWVDKLYDELGGYGEFKNPLLEETLELLKARQAKIQTLADAWLASSENAVSAYGVADYLLYADAIKYYLREIGKQYEVERKYDEQMRLCFVQKVKGPFNNLPPEIVGVMGLGNLDLLKIYASLNTPDEHFEKWRGKITENVGNEEVVQSSISNIELAEQIVPQSKETEETKMSTKNNVKQTADTNSLLFALSASIGLDLVMMNTSFIQNNVYKAIVTMGPLIVSSVLNVLPSLEKEDRVTNLGSVNKPF